MSNPISKEAGSKNISTATPADKSEPVASKSVFGWIKSKIPGSYARSKGVRVWSDSCKNT